MTSGPSASAADPGGALHARELPQAEADLAGESVVVRARRQPDEPTPKERADIVYSTSSIVVGVVPVWLGAVVWTRIRHEMVTRGCLCLVQTTDT